MGLSIVEFRVAMETYGAKRLDDRFGSRYNIKVPCFRVSDVVFLHSGSYYIVNRGREISDEIMNRAMAEFGEKEPGVENYWYKEIHTVKGILTLAAMLENRYSREWINELTNETYKKLLKISNFVPEGKADFISNHTAKMQELYDTVMEYDKVVNPYNNTELAFREPIEYMGEVGLKVALADNYVDVNLKNSNRYICFHSDEEGWAFLSNGFNDPTKRDGGGTTAISHYYDNGIEEVHIDEIVCLEYLSGGGFDKREADIDLRISLQTGFAWEKYKQKEAKLATDEQIDLMITYLKKCIAEIRETIIAKMII